MEEINVPKKRASQKSLIAIIVLIIVAAVIGIHLLSMVTWDRQLHFEEVTYRSEKLDDSLDGMVIAFVSDTHEIGEDQIEEISDKITEHGADLLLLGGDFAGSGDTTRKVLQAMGRVDKQLSRDPGYLGAYGVDGNHDNSNLLYGEYIGNGITPLYNTGGFINQNIFLAGVMDHQYSDGQLELALHPLDEKELEDGLVILLCHDPAIFREEETEYVDLILSGHNHGGQMTFFGLWAPALYFMQGHDARYVKGWYGSSDSTEMYVGRGAGQYIKYPRVFAWPEVTFITLEKGEPTTDEEAEQ